MDSVKFAKALTQLAKSRRADLGKGAGAQLLDNENGTGESTSTAFAGLSSSVCND